MKNIKIINEPRDDYIYEFAVARDLGNNTFEWIANFTNGFLASELAHNTKNGVVLHNARIAGKIKKPIDK